MSNEGNQLIDHLRDEHHFANIKKTIDNIFSEFSEGLNLYEYIKIKGLDTYFLNVVIGLGEPYMEDVYYQYAEKGQTETIPVSNSSVINGIVNFHSLLKGLKKIWNLSEYKNAYTDLFYYVLNIIAGCLFEPYMIAMMDLEESSEFMDKVAKIDAFSKDQKNAYLFTISEDQMKKRIGTYKEEIPIEYCKKAQMNLFVVYNSDNGRIAYRKLV